MLTSVVGAGNACGPATRSGREVNCVRTLSMILAIFGTPGSSASRQKLPCSWYHGLVTWLVTVPSGAFVYVVTWCQTQNRMSGGGQDPSAAVQTALSLRRLF